LTFEETQGGAATEVNPMAALLDQETVALRELRRGEIIEGTVVGTDRDGILVDVGAKSEGVIPPNEMHCLQPEGASSLNTGDKVLVAVVQPESHEGQIILSMDRARGERGWRVLQDYLDNGEAFEGYVTGSNKGGLLVNVEGVNAFVPLSQIVAGPERGNPEATQTALAQWVGKNITLKVIELNRRRNRAILSERSAVQEKRAAEKERLLLELQEGDIRDGRITSIRDFGIFVDIGGADGLVHLSELSWERTPRSPHEFFKVGEEIQVYVLKVDNEAKKIALSVRRAQPERWEEIVSSYREGQIVPGQVTKLAPFGAFVRLEGPIEGLIHISELVDRRITHPREVVEENDVVPVKIVRIEYDRHRLGLSLKQARESAEDDGWAFSAAGSTTLAPQDALDRLGLAAMPQRAAPPEDSDYTDESPEAAAPESKAVADTVEAPSVEAEIAVEVEAETTGAASEPAAEAEIAAPEAEALEEAATEPEPPADVEAAFEELALAPEASAEEAVAEVEVADAPEEAPEAEAEAILEPEAEETTADVEAVSEEAAPEPEVSVEEAVAEVEVADAPEEAPEAEAEAVLEPEAEQATPEEQPETSFEEGIEAAAEGAAPDVTESASDAFNKAGESE